MIILHWALIARQLMSDQRRQILVIEEQSFVLTPALLGTIDRLPQTLLRDNDVYIGNQAPSSLGHIAPPRSPCSP